MTIAKQSPRPCTGNGYKVDIGDPIALVVGIPLQIPGGQLKTEGSVRRQLEELNNRSPGSGDIHLAIIAALVCKLF